MLIAEHHASCQHGWDNTPITGRTEYTQTSVQKKPDNEKGHFITAEDIIIDQNTQRN